jgi:hypothetical protein
MAIRQLHLPVVVIISDAIGAVGCHLLLTCDWRRNITVAMKISPGFLVLQSDTDPVSHHSTSAIEFRLPVRAFDNPIVIDI